MGRAEIDTGTPFRSVKEAVTLFGERILMGNIIDQHINNDERRNKGEDESGNVVRSKSIEELEAELSEAKESLKKALEENNLLSNLLQSLTQELQTTKAKLNHSLIQPSIHFRSHPDDVEDDNITEIKMNRFDHQNERYDNDDHLERRRSVKFASPPLLTKEIVDKEESPVHKKNQSMVMKKHTKKMKPLVPLASWLFARNRSS